MSQILTSILHVDTGSYMHVDAGSFMVAWQNVQEDPIKRKLKMEKKRNSKQPNFDKTGLTII